MRFDGRAGKMLVPLLGVLAVLAMAVAAVAIVLYRQEQDKRQAKERELLVTQAENDDLRTNLKEVQQAKARVEEDLARTQKDLTDSQDKLAESVKAQEVLQHSVEDREKEISRLTKDLEQVRLQHKEISAQLSELQSEHDSLKVKFDSLEQAKGELESKVMQLSDKPTVELDKVLVTSDHGSQAPAQPLTVSATSTTSSTEGQVVVVNREYDFIVMNLGKRHGLSIGQEFQILRGSEVLGKVKVEKVYDELSAAAILPESKKENIHEGDLVKAL